MPKKKRRANGKSKDVERRPKKLNGVEMAIAACEGNQAELARRIGKTRANVNYWKDNGIVPVESVLDVEKATGVHRHYLNPKVYPDPPADAA